MFAQGSLLKSAKNTGRKEDNLSSSFPSVFTQQFCHLVRKEDDLSSSVLSMYFLHFS